MRRIVSGSVLAALLWGVSVASSSDTTHVSLIAFGDVNLGRAVGQELLKGDLDYPFAQARPLVTSADIVFVNLESQLSEQGGETQHPKYNLIFCGPPEGAKALRHFGVTVVSTANNHAFDYGLKGLRETIDYVTAEGMRYVGTSKDSTELFAPAIIESNGVRVGFVAYTEFVNMKLGWQGRIAVFEEPRVQREIERLRATVDVVVASYHGGNEYVDTPHRRTLRNLRLLAEAGADVVIGHHPHVPQGIERHKGTLIAYSLGNFVFYQPQRHWTQRGFALNVKFRKSLGTTRPVDARIVPLMAGKQPSPMILESERASLLERLQRLSTVPIRQEGEWFRIDLSD
ncbi:MAG TPA: CapA family protein [Bacteroidota bacterium]|nr:CapA family protein [Bacteroidota bacterium]